MLNNLLIQTQQNLIQSQENQDPVANILERLSYGTDIKVKLYNEETSFPRTKTENAIQIDLTTLNSNATQVQPSSYGNILQGAISNKRSPGFPNQIQKLIIEKLKSIPVYTVVNNNNEVIVASSRDQDKKNTVDHFRTIYNTLFSWNHDEGNVSIILFFMNKEDASSYLHEICKKDPKESEKAGVHIKTTGLDTFYKFNKTSPPGLQAKLVGDLKEVEFVIEKTKRDPFITLNPKQRTEDKWFQGTPIYTIRLNKTIKPNELKKYSIKTISYSRYIFFRKEDAEKAWETYKTKSKNVKMETRPHLELYNLENLLVDLEKNDVKDGLDMILVPTYENERESDLKTIPTFEMEYSRQETLFYSLKLKFENIKRFYKGIIWLITSDTLPSEENSW